MQTGHWGPCEDKIWELSTCRKGIRDLDAMGIRMGDCSTCRTRTKDPGAMGTGTGDFSTCRQGTGDSSATGIAHSHCASAGDIPARAFLDTDLKPNHASQSYRPTTLPSPFPAGTAKSLKGKAKMLGTYTFCLPQIRSHLPPSLPVRKSPCGAILKTNLITANEVPKAKSGTCLWGHRNNLQGLCSCAAQPFPA